MPAPRPSVLGGGCEFLSQLPGLGRISVPSSAGLLWGGGDSAAAAPSLLELPKGAGTGEGLKQPSNEIIAD